MSKYSKVILEEVILDELGNEYTRMIDKIAKGYPTFQHYVNDYYRKSEKLAKKLVDKENDVW